ncbi:MAG: hypothetical protein U0K86_13360 [Agathobacter sp.]|nr:hypothetical protein [Agathobacter sp.]
MTISEFNSVLDSDKYKEAYIISYTDGKEYKGKITNQFQEEGYFELKELVPFGVKYVLKYEDVIEMRYDPLGQTKEFIEGLID